MSEGQWHGQTAICVASGPSLTRADCDLAAHSGHKIIAVNNSWCAVPTCDVVYASDYAWWKRNAKGLTIPAARWSNNRKAVCDYQCEHFPTALGCNSGLVAIHLAHWFGAVRILLLGYDMQHTHGEVHWHGAHARGHNPNRLSFKVWQKQYLGTSKVLRDKVINCSRETALKLFARSTLETALATLGTEARLPQGQGPYPTDPQPQNPSA